MGGLVFDWAGVLSDPPLHWLITGLLTTLAVTFVASLAASLLAVVILGLRVGENRLGAIFAQGVIELFRNTPILVQILFWYFAAYALLPQGFRDWVNLDHAWATLPGNVPLTSPEFIASAWGLAVFSAVFIEEEIRAGLLAIPSGQKEAALAQGFGHWETLFYILLPQALRNAFQPIVGQYLNLMKLSSLATAIGLAEITYQVRQIESFNSHAIEAFAVGTLLYLAIGLAMSRAFQCFEPARHGVGSSGRAGDGA